MKFVIFLLMLCLVPFVFAEESITIGNETVFNKSSDGAEFDCYESAWSYEHDKVGFVIYGPNRYFNTCERDMKNSTKLLFPTKNLMVYSCIDGEPGITNIPCELDCHDGTCLTDEEFPVVRKKCVDRDGGDDEFKRGYTTSAFGRQWDVCVNQEQNETEKCVGEDCFLTEYICDSHERHIEKLRIKCEYGCSAGACFNCKECVYDGVCYSYTDMYENLFCNASLEWETLYPVGASCQESYQCDTQFCKDNECFVECTGCWDDRTCIAFDTVIEDKYCNRETQKMDRLKYVGDTCAQNFECETKQCHKGICRPKCDGCYTPEWNCKQVRLRFRDQYCGFDKELHPLKEFDDFCMDDFECADGYCDGICKPYSVWNKMMTWLRNLF